MKNKKTIENHNFKFEGEYPKNIFRCQFFKIASDDIFGQRRMKKSEAYCSIKDEILVDYKICCTKHYGSKIDNYRHCTSYLEKEGNMFDKDRLELRNLELMKQSVDKASKSTKVAMLATIAAIFMLIIAIIGIGLTYWEPIRKNKIETEQKIVSLYRSIAANQTFFIDNSNEKDKLKKENFSFDALPKNYIKQEINESIHDELQIKIGMVNYQFLNYYLEQTELLNKTIINNKDKLFKNESANFTIYLGFVDYLNKEKWSETKFNYIHDTSCIMHILREAFPYIKDERNNLALCNNNSLNRIYYHFSYFEVDTPEWMKPKFKEALKERGIDAWRID